MALVGPATRRRERRGPDGLGRDRQELGRIPLAARVARPAPRVDRPVGARCVPHVRDPGRVVASGARRVGPASLLDRKSTRLNSSHSQISYAVFCLKKKKKTKTQYVTSAQ